MDPVLLTIQLLLGALGILGVATGDPAVLTEHAGRFLGALLLTVLVSFIRPRTVVKLSPAIYVSLLLMLVLVLFIGVSPEGSQSNRWLLIGGFTFQPSELMKVAVIAYLAAFFHNHFDRTPIWKPTAVIGLACGLIILQPDLGTSVFVFLLALGIMFIGPVPAQKVFAVGGLTVVVGVMFGSLFLSDFTYFADRIDSFFDLHGDQSLAQDVSFQAVQARRILDDALPAEQLAEIRLYLQQQRALGRDAFKAMVEAKTRRFASARLAHRPRRRAEEASD